MSTELRPTPECDANAFVASKAAAFGVRQIVGGEHHGLYDAIPLKLGEKLERERDTLLDQLEAQAVQIEALRKERDEALALSKNYSERWTAECKTLRDKIEAMREAIKEAYDALMLAPYRDQEALAKLKPLLP